MARILVMRTVTALGAWVVLAPLGVLFFASRTANPAGNLVRAVALLVGLALGLGSLAAYGQERSRRVALVIGNSSYGAPHQLKNPINDVRDIGSLLGRAGFEVISIEDGNHEDIRRGLLKFERLLEQSRVGLFYFSGHGVQSRDGKRNLLLPVGQNYREMRDVEVHGVDAAQVLDRMKIAGSSLNIVVLDACRSQLPFPDQESKGIGQTKGLARIDTPSGSLVAFAAAPGKVALDDIRGNNSRYTKHLLQAIATPGLGLNEVFQYVQGKVEDETYGAQSPELLNKLRDPRPFYFIEPRKMENMSEPMVGSGDRTVIGTSTSDKSGQSSTANRAYGNRGVALRPRSLIYGPQYDHRRAVATFEMENRSGRDIWIGIAAFDIGPCRQDRGMYNVTSGIRKITGDKIYPLKNGTAAERRSYLTELPAGGRLVVIATAEACHASSDPSFSGKTVPVAIEFGAELEGQFQLFDTSIADFPITSNLR
jgi:uncharacterized caspase-like protein